MKSVTNVHAYFCVLLAAALVFPQPTFGFDFPFFGKSESKNDSEYQDDGYDRYGFKRTEQSEEDAKIAERMKKQREQLDLAIENTKKLISRSYQRPYMPELYLRLAELYVEKSRVAYFQRRAEGGSSVRSSLDSIESGELKTKAIEIYLKIINNYPEFEHIGKAYFFMAHEYRELGRTADMVNQYEKLISDHPNSEYVPEAHLLLGDHFFEKKLIDKAKVHYERVLSYPNSTALSIARYKLAWVHINKKDFASAAKLLEDAVQIETGVIEDVTTYDRVNVRYEALIDLAFVYTDQYEDHTPEETLKYFKKYAWSRPAYVAVMEKLAKRYLIKRKWRHASFVYRELATKQADPIKILEYSENIYTTSRQMNNFDFVDSDVRNMIDALRKIKYSVHFSDEKKTELMGQYELYARDIITRLHDMSKRPQQNESLESSLANAYKAYIEFFDDSPEYQKMALNYAESLFLAQKFVEAGRQYEALAQNQLFTEDEENLLYSATLAYYRALKDQRAQLNHFELAQASSGLAEVGQIYAQKYPRNPKTPDVLFNVAWIQYDKGNFETAINEFKAFIETYPRTKEADAAIRLTVDAYQNLEDYESLSAFDDYLEGIPGISAGLLTETRKMSASAENRVISQLTVASVENWESGKDKLAEYARTNESSDLGRSALRALFISSKEQNDIKEMHRAGVDFVEKYPDAEDAKKILQSLIDTSIKVNQFRALATVLELYVDTYPRDKKAPGFLYQAAALRDQLGEPYTARLHYSRLLKEFSIPVSMRQSAAQYLVDSAEDRGRFAEAISILEHNKRYFTRSQQPIAAAQLASLFIKQGDVQSGFRYYQQAAESLSKQDEEYRYHISEAGYLLAGLNNKRYFAIQLTDEIDPDLVAKKTELLEKIQSEFEQILALKVPEWAILSCYRIYEINNEYASFLLNAPLPDLEGADLDEYRAAIAENAAPYQEAANEFLKTGNQLADKLNSRSKRFQRYEISKNASETGSFLAASPPIAIEMDAFEDELLRKIHNRISRYPDKIGKRLELANAYYNRGDFGNANAIFGALLEDIDKLTESQKTRILTSLGIIAMKMGRDDVAVSNFEKALGFSENNKMAHLHLGALNKHYGLEDETEKHFSELPSEIDTSVWEGMYIQEVIESYRNWSATKRS